MTKFYRGAEKRLQEICEDFLLHRGIPYIHLRNKITRVINGRYFVFPIEGNVGFPDLIIFLPHGKTIFVELKINKILGGKCVYKGRLSEAQIARKRDLENLGFKYFVIRDYRAFIRLIDCTKFFDQINKEVLKWKG